MMAVEERDSLIEFPCDFDVKAMGLTSPEFDSTVVTIIRGHVDDIKEGAIKTKQSSGGKFTSITVNVYVENQVQLEIIYQALSNHDLVKYVL
jgi:putative lipoic acid-binding regulatory protein